MKNSSVFKSCSKYVGNMSQICSNCVVRGRPYKIFILQVPNMINDFATPELTWVYVHEYASPSQFRGFMPLERPGTGSYLYRGQRARPLQRHEIRWRCPKYNPWRKYEFSSVSGDQGKEGTCLFYLFFSLCLFGYRALWGICGHRSFEGQSYLGGYSCRNRED